MLDRNDRFYAPSGTIYPGGPSIWHVIDWDQRRLVSVKLDNETESEDAAFDLLLRHIDHLAPDVYLIYLSPQGDVLATSNDPSDDETLCAYRPLLDMSQMPKDTTTISRPQLAEVARLGPNVDLVRDPSRPNENYLNTFFLSQHLSFAWHEMSLWCRLSHPSIVPFDKVVVDELEGRFVGFTTKYIAGGTLEENKTRIFKLKWLHQLIDVVDTLNLQFGVAHQDVAPRNILINQTTDTLMLFDFNFAARIGRSGYSEARNDVKGVVFTLFEIITRDSARRGKRHEEQDVAEIDAMDWTLHPQVRLDCSVSHIRHVLDTWRQQRLSRAAQVINHTPPPGFLDWPPVPDPPLTDVEVQRVTATDTGTQVKTVTEKQRLYDWRRSDLLKQGKPVLSWQREPQHWPSAAQTSLGC